jgi:hypothetical protein
MKQACITCTPFLNQYWRPLNRQTVHTSAARQTKDDVAFGGSSNHFKWFLCQCFRFFFFETISQFSRSRRYWRACHPRPVIHPVSGCRRFLSIDSGFSSARSLLCAVSIECSECTGQPWVVECHLKKELWNTDVDHLLCQ